MRIVNPFILTDAPDHMMLERKLRHRHIYQTLILATIGAAIALYGTPLLVWIYNQHMPFGPRALNAAGAYASTLWGPDPWAPHRVMVNQTGFVPGFLSILPGEDSPQLRVFLTYLTVGMTTATIIGLRQLTNPYRRMLMKQDASWCDAPTLRAMEQRQQVGIRKGYLMSLGKWVGGVRHGQEVRMIEPLSCLCLAPPGTGKTAGLVIPSIVGCDTVSFIVNDRKPEVYDMTAGYRETMSHVIMMDWSKVDTHNIAQDAETGETIVDAAGIPVVIHTFYPRFNPLSPKMVPQPGPDRDTYVSTVANVLVPSSKEGKGENDYFSNKGRDAITGMIHMLLARVNDRAADDKLRYDGMPRRWVGKEASLGMLADWISYAQFAASGDTSESPEGFPNAAASSDEDKDKIGSWLRAICEEINPETKLGGDTRGTTARGFASLSQLVTMADRERSGVLGTMDQALLPFKNESVQQRTESSDFTPDDMRGIQGADGTWKPVTLYICVNQAEADAFATITALLYEILSRSLLTYKQDSYNPRTKRQLGPYVVCFALDEFSKLPRISAVLEGPDTGRSMGVSYMLVAQSYGQIEKVYSTADVQVMNTVTSVKHILPQNEATTIKAITEMVGKTTIRRPAHSFTEGVGKDVNAFKWNRSDTMEETDFLRQQEIVAMPQGTHILIVQGFNNRPMRLTTTLFFNDPKVAAKVRSRGVGPIATMVLPKHVRAARLKEYEQDMHDKELLADDRYATAAISSVRLDTDVRELA